MTFSGSFTFLAGASAMFFLAAGFLSGKIALIGIGSLLAILVIVAILKGWR